MTRGMTMEHESFINKDIVSLDPERQDLTFSSQTVKRDIPKYWEKDYINSHIDQVNNHKHRMFFIFMWMSGARVTEVISIRQRDIDIENYTVTLRWLKSRKYQHRVVPLHPELRNMLQVYMASLKSDDKLFPWTRQRAYQITKKYFYGHPHQFRHSFAVNWLRSGGDVVVLHRILGHSKLQTTMEYLKIVPIDQGKELIKVSFR